MPVLANGKQLSEEAARRYGLNPDIFSSQIYQESRYNPYAVSSKGAQGIAQFMPATAQRLGVKNPFDPLESLDKAAKYMRKLLDDYGSYELALAAYNSGEGSVNKYQGIPPYKETQNYVKEILGRAGVAFTQGVKVATQSVQHIAESYHVKPETTKAILYATALILIITAFVRIR